MSDSNVKIALECFKNLSKNNTKVKKLANLYFEKLDEKFKKYTKNVL